MITTSADVNLSITDAKQQTTLPSSTLLFYVNGTRIELDHPDPDLTLLQYLRHLGLRGTKLGCGEGGCGACTVMVSSYRPVKKTIEHIPVNACLAPLCAMDGKHIVTVEGIGKSNNPHPVQERIAKLHGSQCGFCTPGIVMSLYTLLRNEPNPTEEMIEESFDGNLCRCTGYRPILDAAKTFAIPDKNSCVATKPSGCGLADCCMNKGNDSIQVEIHGLEKITLKKYDPTQEIIFPPALIQYIQATAGNGKYRSLHFVGKRTTWYRPSSLEELLKLKEQYPDAKLVAGNSEVGVEIKFKRMHYPTLIYVGDLLELKGYTIDDQGVALNAGITLQHLQAVMQEQVAQQESTRTESFRAILNNLKWFAGRQIRSVGTLAGNIVNASPISDLNPVLLAAGATLTVASAQRGKRTIPIEQFFLGYRRTALAPDEVLVSVHLPFTQPGEHIRAYKQARRKDDDIAIVNAGMRVQVSPIQGGYQITKCVLAYGGMAPTTVIAQHTSQTLVGVQLGDRAAFDAAINLLLQKELRLQTSTPGGMPEYRMSLAASFLFRFWCDICAQYGVCPAEDLCCIPEIERGVSRGFQEIHHDGATKYVGKPMTHTSAMKQVTGEAVYVDDMPSIQGELAAAYVTSSKAHARIKSIDASEAMAIPGVVGFFTAKDVPGANRWGTVVRDEYIFAEDEVVYAGQPIGLIVAENKPTAQRAAALVQVNYEVLPHILTIEEAIAANSFLDKTFRVQRGDLETGFAEADHIFEGEYRMGGQEHFYLETQCSIAVPKNEDGEMDIFASTQNPQETQAVVAEALGVPASRIVCRVKRLGGGFGGKESRSVPLSAAIAVAAHHLRRPVRYMLDRDEDMIMSGQRHPFLGKWRVGVTATGKLTALDLKLYANAGCSFDLSTGVIERAILHSDSVYYIPNVKVEGYMCKTNLASNTAFRGFGGPQGMLIAEAWIHEIADRLGIPVQTFQEMNFYKQGQRTHFNQELVDWNIPKLWQQLKERSSFEQRRAAVDEFNRTSRWKKRGLAMIPTKFGISFGALHLNQAGALVHIYTDGSVLLTHGGTEMGQGLHTKMIQVCAECLDIPPTSIHISETATNTVANTSPTAASASSDLNGMAIKDACDQLNARLRPYRERYPHASFAEIVKKAYFDRVNLSANGFYKTPDIGYDWNTNTGMPYYYFTQGAAVTEIEVDILTGDHTILRTDIMMDIGRSLNYAIDVGQIEGAFMQGVGWCTLEESLCLQQGQLFTRGPGAYKLPGFRDIPQEMRIHVFKDGQHQRLRTINSSKGIGEPPLFLGASVLFAIRDAIISARRDAGCTQPLRLCSPATVERIRLACADPLITASRASINTTHERPWAIQP